MKLPDFTQHEGLNTLRKILGVGLNVNYATDCIWDPTTSKLLEEGELEKLDLQDIGVDNDFTLSYRGNKIVLYVKEQQEQGGEGAYKYHFYDCTMLNTWREERLYNGKYVANIFADFKIDKVSFGRSLQKNVFFPLNICKNCLKESNYKDYNNVDYTKKNYIYKTFNREEYFLN